MYKVKFVIEPGRIAGVFADEVWFGSPIITMVTIKGIHKEVAKSGIILPATSRDAADELSQYEEFTFPQGNLLYAAPLKEGQATKLVNLKSVPDPTPIKKYTEEAIVNVIKKIIEESDEKGKDFEKIVQKVAREIGTDESDEMVRSLVARNIKK